MGPYLVGGHLVDGWVVTLVLARVEEQAGICEVHVQPASLVMPGRWGRATWMREVVEPILDRLENATGPPTMLSVVELRGLPLGTFAAHHWRAHREASSRTDRHRMVVGSLGRRALDPSTFRGELVKAATAERYAALVQTGHRSPLEQLASEFGLSVAGVRRRLAEARAAGYLTPARRGVAAGDLTEAGRDVLAGEEWAT